MIIHQSGGLHVGVNNCAAYKFKTTLFQVFA